MAVVGPGEDALLKAAELANKFEHHVFASTTSKVSSPMGWDRGQGEMNRGLAYV